MGLGMVGERHVLLQHQAWHPCRAKGTYVEGIVSASIESKVACNVHALVK